MLNRIVNNLSSVLSHHLNSISRKGLHRSDKHRRLRMPARLRCWNLNWNIEDSLVAAVNYLYEINKFDSDLLDEPEHEDLTYCLVSSARHSELFASARLLI